MNYYTGKDNKIFGFEDDCEQTQIAAFIEKYELKSVTEQEALLLLQKQKTTEDAIEEVKQEVQRRLDLFAQTRNYNNILSACSYSCSTIDKFKKEAECCIKLRDETWEKCTELLEQVQNKQIKMPTMKQVLEVLPKLEWPETL